MSLIVVGAIAGAIGGVYGWWLWYLFDWKLRPEVRDRDRRRREAAYRERMRNPKYRNRFKE